MSYSERSRTFLPQAPARNMRAIQGELSLPPEKILGGTNKAIPRRLGCVALERQEKFREEYRAAKLVPLEDINAIKVVQRNELVLQAAKIFDQYAVPKTTDAETMRHASLAGCGVAMAFIDLAASMQARAGIEYDEEFFLEAIRLSTKTLLIMAATTREADGILMTNASCWTREQINELSDEDLNSNLFFNPSFFELDDAGAVGLRNDETTRKSIRLSNGHNYDFQPRKDDIMFGCPFRSGIAGLTSAMATASINNGLVERHWANSTL